ncbi:hypothetical protein, conserved [Eimeria praecox]|uniref:Uncharacterized protein n=1 Tax=Eimeria praecox TaxID=51316 RepID=U6H4N1_9EIME|nr:hypothetical protein, conserved [Eimeria praecox]
MGPGSATCAIVFVLALSLCRGLAYSRQHRLIATGTGLRIQGLLRQDSPLLEVLRQESPVLEASSVQWRVSDSSGDLRYFQESENSGTIGDTFPILQGALRDEKEAKSSASLLQISLSPLDDSALALYHKVFRESIQGSAKPTTPKNDAQEEAEVKEVVQVIRQFSGAPAERIRNDRNVMAAIQHSTPSLASSPRSLFCRSGFAGLFESLASESIFTIAHSILHTGASLGFSFKPMLTSGLKLVQGCLKMAMSIQSIAGPAFLLPGGVVGTILQYFIRAFNLVFFPPLLAVTGGLAGAMGVACLLGVPTLLSEVYNFVSAKVIKGVTALYKHTQLFRLRSDPHGVKLLKSSFSGKFVSMLTQLWQLDSVGLETLENSVPHLTTFSSEVFSQGFLNGIVHFSKEYTTLMEEEYLTGYEETTTKCYCEGTFRRLEAFSTRSMEVLNFISWIAFRDYIAELLLMVYNTARLSLEAQIKQSENPSIETLRAAFAEVGLQDSLVANIVVKPRLQRDVHNFTSGVAGITTFFMLRKLHQWKPSSVDARTASAIASGTVLKTKTKQEDEELSLVAQRLEAFAEVEMPPELATAVPEFKIVEDKSVTRTEAILLGKYAAKRDILMMSLLRRSLQKLIGAFDSIFGRLEKMVRATIGRDRIQTCKLTDRNLCFNTDEATKAKFAALQFVLAAHLGVAIGTDEKLTESAQDLKDDFMSFIKDAAWFRYRPRTLRVFRRRARWGLDILIDHLFPKSKKGEKNKGPISEEHLTTIELAEPPITPEMREKLCTPEHEFVEFSAWYMQKDVGGYLLVPGFAEINGFMVDSKVVLRAKHNDESAAYLIEAALWSKGIPRIDALMAADLLVATKRMLYSNKSWEEFFNNWTPTDLDYVQYHFSSGMRLEREKYIQEERKALYSLDFSADGFLELLVRSLESTVITAGSLSAGLSDLALIFPVTVGLEALRMAEKNATGLTSMLGRFQVLLWDEYAAKKQPRKTASTPYHSQTSVESAEPIQPARKGSHTPSISDAFAHEEGTSDPLFADWCEELYSRAVNSLDEPGSAKLDALDAGIIQCSLLRFLGKRQKGEPAAKEKDATFRYLHHVTEILRKAKKTDRFFNILRGPEFLRTLQLAAVEAFADQALFPSKVLISPTTLAAFTRIRTLMKFEVLPLLNRPEGAEVITQMKMMPTPSPAMNRLIERLKAQLEAAKTTLGSTYRRHVRQCAGYLSLLSIASSVPACIGSNLPHLFSRFVSLVDRPTEANKGEYVITRRSLAYLTLALICRICSLAGRKLQSPRLGRASLFLFCNVVIPTLVHPQHQRRREAGMKQMQELRELLITSELPLYFQINKEATSLELDFQDLESLIIAAQNVQLHSEGSQQAELTASFLLHAPLMKALEIMGLVTETVGDDFVASPLQCTPEDKSSGIWYTIPINGSSRLRMITSMLIQLADAEDVLERLEESNMAGVIKEKRTAEGASTVTTATTEEPTTSSDDEGKFVDVEEPSNTRSIQISEQTDTGSSGSAFSENEGTSTLELTVDSEELAEPSQTNVDARPSSNSSTPAKSEEKGLELKYSGDRALAMAIKADQEGLRNARATVQHLKEQVSLFEAHSSAFVSSLHTLVSIAQLPSRLYGSVSRRFIDNLATTVFGKPWAKVRRVVLPMVRLKRKDLHRRMTLRRPVAKRRGEYATWEATNENASFSTVFLPSSVKDALNDDALNDVRKKWRSLLQTDFLAVRSAACKQDADLWLKDELEGNEQTYPEVSGRGQIVDAVITPEQFKRNHEGRQQLCVHPIWLELRSRISVEQDLLEAERLFSYFVRMGIKNAKLIQQSADQGDLHESDRLNSL